jgi:hypothetical protein
MSAFSVNEIRSRIYARVFRSSEVRGGTRNLERWRRDLKRQSRKARRIALKADLFHQVEAL